MARYKKVNGKLVLMNAQEISEALAANRRFACVTSRDPDTGENDRAMFTDAKEAKSDTEEAREISPAVVIPLKKAAAKEEAQRKIVAIAPEWQQRNYLARSIELTRKPGLTPGEQAEEAALQAAWDQIKAIRLASNNIEAELDLAADPANYDVANSPLWPEDA